jgi:hypothetical protein
VASNGIKTFVKIGSKVGRCHRRNGDLISLYIFVCSELQGYGKESQKQTCIIRIMFF